MTMRKSSNQSETKESNFPLSEINNFEMDIKDASIAASDPVNIEVTENKENIPLDVLHNSEKRIASHSNNRLSIGRYRQGISNQYYGQHQYPMPPLPIRTKPVADQRCNLVTASVNYSISRLFPFADGKSDFLFLLKEDKPMLVEDQIKSKVNHENHKNIQIKPNLTFKPVSIASGNPRSRQKVDLEMKSCLSESKIQGITLSNLKSQQKRKINSGNAENKLNSVKNMISSTEPAAATVPAILFGNQTHLNSRIDQITSRLQKRLNAATHFNKLKGKPNHSSSIIENLDIKCHTSSISIDSTNPNSMPTIESNLFTNILRTRDDENSDNNINLNSQENKEKKIVDSHSMPSLLQDEPTIHKKRIKQDLNISIHKYYEKKSEDQFNSNYLSDTFISKPMPKQDLNEHYKSPDVDNIQTIQVTVQDIDYRDKSFKIPLNIPYSEPQNNVLSNSMNGINPKPAQVSQVFQTNSFPSYSRGIAVSYPPMNPCFNERDSQLRLPYSHQFLPYIPNPFYNVGYPLYPNRMVTNFRNQVYNMRPIFNQSGKLSNYTYVNNNKAIQPVKQNNKNTKIKETVLDRSKTLHENNQRNYGKTQLINKTGNNNENIDRNEEIPVATKSEPKLVPDIDIQKLESLFKLNQYPTNDQVINISSQMNLDAKKIRSWYRTRRLIYKRGTAQQFLF